MGCFDEGDYTVDVYGRGPGDVNLFEVLGTPRYGDEIRVGDCHEVRVAEDLQTFDPAEVYGCKVQRSFVMLVPRVGYFLC